MLRLNSASPQRHVMKRRKHSSLRLMGYDYSRKGAYFITICTRNHALFFNNCEVESIVESIWSNLPERFPTIELDEFITLPNHIHFIIWLDPEDVGAQINCAPMPDGKMDASFGGKGKQVDHLHPTIGQIIRSFKSQVTRKVLYAIACAVTWSRFVMKKSDFIYLCSATSSEGLVTAQAIAYNGQD